MAKILVVDDENALRVLYKHELTQDGHDVDLASTADEAVAKVRETAYDVVILDIRMPGKDGLEALTEMFAERRNIKVIINSAYSSYKENFISWAAEHYVVKSADTTELKEKIAQVLGG
ncbi:MAG TPA: response regulator [Candidatus Latescibacteria bacterium]|nr:response regulator [Candidatus Latescibacterota bacterium]HQE60724.1 response regulator [Candidatus Latescibacterota bacterium]HQI76931.1 response regulator [Candidatus Latescibacterota bacterium]